MVIGVLEPLNKRNDLQDLFIKLMEYQPAKYILGDEFLGKALYGDSTLLLAWSRDPLRRRSPIRKATREVAEELLRCGSKTW
jgi:hypothetical protein